MTIYSTTTGHGGIDSLDVYGVGRYIRLYGAARGTNRGYSLWELEVYGTPASNLALCKPTAASSTQNNNSDWTPDHAVDGDPRLAGPVTLAIHSGLQLTWGSLPTSAW